MARPRIGIFGTLVAAGGILAWRWSQQRRRAAQVPLSRDLSRWEGEGGSIATPAQPAAATANTAGNGGAANGMQSGAANGATNGTGHPAGAGEPWPFPHG
ncbi:hypothetical protein [Paraburkholderia gardini]|uniref:Uncharacterized protein n=1 Tax=Paraburkholderia gardini TaxID=2823469 RepID=A0ABM8TXJ4_9BURK|nr:hypothetical protein [Paraburkholderia gardini]CAG4886427.1 hypothetical protein R54767_00210 [Paraburkholderia gardini]CAG4895899.1 hypothetical protein R69919_02092 [Paraburkholderia gardini]